MPAQALPGHQQSEWQLLRSCTYLARVIFCQCILQLPYIGTPYSAKNLPECQSCSFPLLMPCLLGEAVAV